MFSTKTKHLDSNPIPSVKLTQALTTRPQLHKTGYYMASRNPDFRLAESQALFSYIAQLYCTVHLRWRNRSFLSEHKSYYLPYMNE